MGFNREETQKVLDRWQKVLRLQDWDLKLEMVTTEWRKSGDVKIDMCNRQAVVMVNANTDMTNLEELVIHELLHIKLWGMDQMIEELINLLHDKGDEKQKSFAYSQFMLLLESTVEDLTKGYLTASNLEAPSFHTVNREVKKELG